MAILNTFRLLVLATVAAVAFLYMREKSPNYGPYSPKERSKRDLKAWFKYPYTCSNTRDRYIALTFDEGPADRTGAVLDALRWWDVKATFHFQTHYLANPENIKIIQRAYNEGHLVGLRWDPQLPAPDKMPIKQFRDELLRQSNDLAYWMGQNKYPKYLRLPYNQTTEEINQVLTELGFVATGWNVDPQDYAITDNTDPNYVGEMIRREAPAHRSMIVLMHDIYPRIANWINNTIGIVVNIKQTTTANDTILVTLDRCIGDAPYRLSNGGGSTGGPGTPTDPNASPTPQQSGNYSAADKVKISIERMVGLALAVVAIAFATLL